MFGKAFKVSFCIVAENLVESELNVWKVVLDYGSECPMVVEGLMTLTRAKTR